MTLKKLLLFICIIALTTAKAQTHQFQFKEAPKFETSSTLAFIYAIPLDSVKRIAYTVNSHIDPNVYWLQKPTYIVPRISLDSFFNTNAPGVGHYLSVTAVENQIRFRLHHRAGFSVLISNLEQIKLINVRDSFGNELKDATIQLGKKFLSYDTAMNGYVVGKFRGIKTLTVRHGTDVQYFYCYSEQNNTYVKPSWQNESSRTARETRTFKGYVVTNKPVYLPGDTVKWKAYIENPYHKDRLVEEKLRISFAEGYQWKAKQFLIASEESFKEPGVYFGEFVVGDTVQMDKEYKLDIYGTKSGLHLQTTFKTEDYLLDDIHLKVSGAGKNLYQPGDSVNLFAYAYNSNNLPVLDGQLSITVSPVLSFNPVKDQTFIPDTLYHASVLANASGETNISFSTKGFDTSITYLRCKLSLVNSNNEHADTALVLAFINPRPYLKVQQIGRKLTAEYVQNKKSVPTKGRVQIHTETRDFERSISFPYEYTLSEQEQSFTFYELNEAGEKHSASSFRVQPLGIEGIENFHGDTALLELKNPFHLNFRYSIFFGKKFKGYGSAQSDTLIKIVSKKGRTVSLMGSYIWRGETINQNFSIFRMDRDLEIEMHKKELVYPGQKDSISIHLKNKEGDAVAHTNVTVLAFNSRFTEDYTMELPYSGSIYPAYRPKISRRISRFETQAPYSRFIDSLWLSRCGADTMFFYKNLYLLHHDTAWLTYNIPGSVYPQLGVMIQKSGSFIQPAVIYVDGDPVFMNRATGANLQGFFVPEGKHSIRIRLQNAEHNIPSIQLNAGMKTDLYLKVDSVGPVLIKEAGKKRWAGNHLSTMMSKSIKPDTFYESEISLLKNYLLMYRPEGYYYKLEDESVELGNPQFFQWPLQIATSRGFVNFSEPGFSTRASIQLVGPFNRYRSIGFLQQGNTKLRFEREPNYVYMFRPQQTRVETCESSRELKDMLVNKVNWPQVGYVCPNPQDFDSLLLIAEPEFQMPDGTRQIIPGGRFAFRQILPDLNYASSIARLELKVQGKIQDSLRYIRQYAVRKLDATNQVFILKGSIGIANSIPAGEYELFLLWDNQRYSIYHRISLKEGGTNLLPVSYDDHCDSLLFENIPAWLKPFISTRGKKKKVTAATNAKETTFQYGVSGISGRLLDETGEPIISAAVEITQGGIDVGRDYTDIHGYYAVKLPYGGRYEVRFTYMGKECRFDDISVATQQVVHVNGRISMTNELSGSRIFVSRYYDNTDHPLSRQIKSAMQIEKSATRQVSDIASLSTQVYMGGYGSGLSIGGGRDIDSRYVIDGVQLTVGTNAAVTTSSQGSEQKPNLKDLLLDRNASASKEFFGNFLSNMMAASGMRRSFRDWAIWEPNLWTNSDGMTSFNVTYPDNITSWKTYVLAMNRDAFAGRTMEITRAFKPLSAELLLPRFLRYGDTAEGVGKVANYTEQPFKLRTTFSLNGVNKTSDTITVHNARVDKVIVVAPKENSFDSAALPVSYTFTADNGYTDGETREIPVWPVGVVESKGSSWFLKNDTTVSSQPDTTAGHFSGHMRIQIDASMLEVMLREAEHLKGFPHSCNEQLTTKLLAIYYEDSIRKMLGRNDIRNSSAKKKIIGQLIRAQRPDGGFTWWGNDGIADYRITNYILSTLQKIKVNDELKPIIERGQSYLISQYPLMNQKDQLTTLQTLMDGNYASSYELFLDKLDTQKINSVYDRLMLIYLRKQQGLSYRTALNAVMKDRVETANGIYWGQSNFDWYRDDLAATLLAYSIVKNDSAYKKFIPAITRYILFKKQRGYYSSTASSGLVLTTILPDLLADKALGSTQKHTYVRLSGSVQDSITEFPKTYYVRDNHPSISISKKGISPVYATVVYDYFNINPAGRDSDFVVRTQFMSARSKDILVMNAGERVTLRAVVTCKKDVEYVMIEVPIPAGCIQVDKGKQLFAPESARENFKDQTDIFCASMKPGTYTFEVTLEARFKGSYQVSPARAGLMYYPEVFGNTEVKKVKIR
jgi:hypothetical protein